jgi:hypothetical protein
MSKQLKTLSSWQDVRNLTRFYVLVMRSIFKPLADGLMKTPLAYQQTIHQDREKCKQILWDLGEYSREMHIIRSNHSDRLYSTLLKTPGLISLPELQYPKFMGFAEMGMTYHKTAYEFHPGWVLMSR